jgi:hypothetical protein
MSWSFKQSTGELFDPSGNLVATGYSGGNCGKDPAGKNNPGMQDVPCVGPLPQGTYTAAEPEDSARLGPFSIPLVPDPQNEMFGRAGFFMHGDSIAKPGAASEGCIIMPRFVREAFWHSSDHSICVAE